MITMPGTSAPYFIWVPNTPMVLIFEREPDGGARLSVCIAGEPWHGVRLTPEMRADLARELAEPMRPVESDAMVETALAFHRHNYGEGRCDVAGCKVCGGPMRTVEP